uniref:Uncharacterized protein n=1 Tax=Cytobacillus firmus TaxID=1399 RepID=O87556_CYTFI|nr:hypothetical protein [Cytobacillus firmus]
MTTINPINHAVSNSCHPFYQSPYRRISHSIRYHALHTLVQDIIRKLKSLLSFYDFSFCGFLFIQQKRRKCVEDHHHKLS